MRLKLDRVTREESSSGGTKTEYYVLGGEHVGASIARRLRATGHPVTVVDETHDPDESGGVRGDPGDVRTLEEVGVTDGSTVVVATPSDSRSLLTAKLVRAHFDVSKIVVLVKAPDRYDLFAEVGCEPVCATSTLSDEVVASLVGTEREVDSA